MIATEQTLENLTLTINQEIHVQAPLDVTFAALLEQLGPGNETPDGPVEGGTATWAKAMDISGPTSKPSCDRRCLSSLVPCSPLSPSSRTSNIG
jgi:hypothetical protein